MSALDDLVSPTIQKEPYLTRVEIADAMKVSVSTIDRWVAAGMPAERWGARARRFKLAECIAWARARGERGVRRGDFAA